MLAPNSRKKPLSRDVDINVFHASYGHAHEVLLRATAKSLGVTLTGKLQPCYGCSLAKGLRKPIPSSSGVRASKRLERVYVDLFGPKLVASIGGKRYVMLVRDCYSRYTWLYFLRNKSDTTEAFKKFLCDVRA